ncbi:carboxypeptidase-like regulatory domain-containing protein [Amnibacterium kyonggiense]
MTASHLQARRHAERAERETARETEELESQSAGLLVGSVHGSVNDTSDRPIARARILLLDQHRGTAFETETDHLGTYRIDGVPVGVHHLLISAPHCEPAVATIASWGDDRDARARDFTLVDWDDPASNLTAEDVAERNALTAPQRPALSH